MKGEFGRKKIKLIGFYFFVERGFKLVLFLLFVQETDMKDLQRCLAYHIATVLMTAKACIMRDLLYSVKCQKVDLKLFVVPVFCLQSILLLFLNISKKKKKKKSLLICKNKKNNKHKIKIKRKKIYCQNSQI